MSTDFVLINMTELGMNNFTEKQMLFLVRHKFIFKIVKILMKIKYKIIKER